MFCQVAQRKFSDFAGSLDTAAIEQRLPYIGAFELTYRCNLKCCHCYCNRTIADGCQAAELSAIEVKRILDEIADAGCLWLLLTGGEVLLREDFRDIYSYAIKKGMLVEVFTNASLIDDAVAGSFAELPPLGIDISIYGSYDTLHDRITGARGSFRKTMEGIERLQKYGVKFSLKTIVMNLNYADLDAMRALAARLGAEFRYDTLISPRIDGRTGPEHYRLAPETLASLDIDEDMESCEKIFNEFWNKKADEALMCGAGVFAFNINPYGVMSPCTMFRSFQYPIKDVCFKDVWPRMVADYGLRSAELLDSDCRACSMQLICSNCPAWSELEANALNRKVGYICAYAKCLEQMFFKKEEARIWQRNNIKNLRSKR